MATLFVVIAPVFTLIAMGRISVRLARWMDGPALLFRAIASASEISVVGASAVFFAGCAIVYALAMLLARLLATVLSIVTRSVLLAWLH